MRSKFWIYATLIFFFTSCEKDGAPVIKEEESVDNDGQVYILNEGAFGQANASIDQYDPENQTLERQLFRSKNSDGAGDVILSMTSNDEHFFIVVNNSGKIEVCDFNMNKTGSINGFKSPRYMQIINSKYAYVTNFLLNSGSNRIDIVDLEAEMITSSIDVTGWCEQMTMIDDMVYVLNPGANKILKINTTNHNIEAELELNEQPLSIQVDMKGQIWVLSTGGFNKEIPALSHIDPVSLQVERTLSFQSLEDFPTWLSTNSTRDSLFYLNDGVFGLSIDATSLPEIPIIPNNMTYMYSLGIDPYNNYIYVSDGKDFQQSGEVSQFTTKGELIHSFECGIGPGNFYFHKQ